MGTIRTVYVFSLSTVALWCSLILLAPVSRLLGFSLEVSSAFYSLFSYVCHQFPERSVFLEAEPLGVCARCTAIYFSFFASMIAFPVLKGFQRWIPPRWILVISLAPMAVDVIFSLAGIHASSMETRVLTGILAGSVFPFFVLPPFFEAIQQMKGHRGDSLSAKQTR